MYRVTSAGTVLNPRSALATLAVLKGSYPPMFHSKYDTDVMCLIATSLVIAHRLVVKPLLKLERCSNTQSRMSLIALKKILVVFSFLCIQYYCLHIIEPN